MRSCGHVDMFLDCFVGGCVVYEGGFELFSIPDLCCLLGCWMCQFFCVHLCIYDSNLWSC